MPDLEHDLVVGLVGDVAASARALPRPAHLVLVLAVGDQALHVGEAAVLVGSVVEHSDADGKARRISLQHVARLSSKNK